MKIFLLGVGAQKAGTSWLHDYLSTRPQTNFGFRKEYHIFDAKELPDSGIYREKVMGKAARKFGTLGSLLPNSSNKNLSRLLSFYSNDATYFQYFRELLASDETILTGDITPSYAGLSPTALNHIKDCFSREEIKTKVIFLMRDPVDRCISAFKMGLRNNEAGSSLEPEFWKSFYVDPSYVYRTRYELTIENLLSTFRREEIYFGFYEELFSADKIKEICDFLGISYGAPNFGKKVNSANMLNREVDEIINFAIREKIREQYSSTYGYVSAMFGRERVGQIWGGLNT